MTRIILRFTFLAFVVTFASSLIACGDDDGATCGDDVAAGAEVCDGADLREESCATQGFVSGTLACNATCDGFVTTACSEEADCGNAVAEGAEACDGTDLAGETCTTQGFTGGTLACNATCDGFVTTACTGGATCGDGVAEGSESCDGSDLAGETCSTRGFVSGTLVCNATCDGFVTTACTDDPVCGDGIRNGVELCDGADVGAETCASQGFDGGTLTCAPSCYAFDYSACTGPGPQCGDGVAEGPEPCDASDLRGQTCVAFGYADGVLACWEDCLAYDFSGCLGVPAAWTCPPQFFGGHDGCDCGCGVVDPDCEASAAAVCDYCSGSGSCGLGSCPSNIDPLDNAICVEAECGNGIVDGTDVCDGADLAGQDCVSQGYDGGTLACAPTCAAFDFSGCAGSGPVCGNDLIEATEVCDGADLAGRTCATMGQGNGELACADDCQSFDTAGCTGIPPEWTCDPSYFGDGACDCGCGVLDADCPDATVASCDYCDDGGSCGLATCPGNIDPVDNAVCTPPACGNDLAEGTEQCDGADLRHETCASLGAGVGVLACYATCDAFDTSGCTPIPGDWTCSLEYYGDGACDCGCGVLDPDCADATVGSCDYCDDAGSCSATVCPGTINPTNNAICG